MDPTVLGSVGPGPRARGGGSGCSGRSGCSDPGGEGGRGGRGRGACRPRGGRDGRRRGRPLGRRRAPRCSCSSGALRGRSGRRAGAGPRRPAGGGAPAEALGGAAPSSGAADDTADGGCVGACSLSSSDSGSGSGSSSSSSRDGRQHLCRWLWARRRRCRRSSLPSSDGSEVQHRQGLRRRHASSAAAASSPSSSLLLLLLQQLELVLDHEVRLRRRQRREHVIGCSGGSGCGAPRGRGGRER